ncbi:MAG: EsaB/YukD family protein [Lachnospiraceae bacterium]|nr:EsaB/YukD family protein [Lachnospiraceae bacterium]
MILVDIYVPSMGNSYDFQLDEEIPVHSLIEEISEMLGQKEHCQIEGDVRKLVLCSRKDTKLLYEDYTLAECNVSNGDSLILV